jgi:hypothetical protein
MRFFSTARKYVPAYGGEGSDRLVEPGSVAKRIFLPTQVSLVVHARKAITLAELNIIFFVQTYQPSDLNQESHEAYAKFIKSRPKPDIFESMGVCPLSKYKVSFLAIRI